MVANIQNYLTVEEFIKLFDCIPKDSNIIAALFAIEDTLLQEEILDSEFREIVESAENIQDVCDGDPDNDYEIEADLGRETDSPNSHDTEEEKECHEFNPHVCFDTIIWN